jgi:hypothetical protein
MTKANSVEKMDVGGHVAIVRMGKHVTTMNVSLPAPPNVMEKHAGMMDTDAHAGLV